MFTLYRLKDGLAPDAATLAEMVRLWRDARSGRLQFLTDLHSADDDQAYLRGTILRQDEVWVAKMDKAIAGFIAFGKGWVNQLYVAPVLQGRGVGTQLLSIAMRCNPTLQLWVFEVNQPAVQFYQRRGFRVVERTLGMSNEAKQPDLRLQWDAPVGTPTDA